MRSISKYILRSFSTSHLNDYTFFASLSWTVNFARSIWLRGGKRKAKEWSAPIVTWYTVHTAYVLSLSTQYSCTDSSVIGEGIMLGTIEFKNIISNWMFLSPLFWCVFELWFFFHQPHARRLYKCEIACARILFLIFVPPVEELCASRRCEKRGAKNRRVHIFISSFVFIIFNQF